MAHKYKDGDKVRVRSDIIEGERYYMADESCSNSVVDEMLELAGKVVTVRFSGNQYRIDEDGGCWGWTDDMFAGLVIDADPEPEPQPQPEDGPKFKVGDRVKVRSDLSDSVVWYKDDLGRRSSCGCVRDMLRKRGKVVTIKQVHSKPDAIWYEICEDPWNWVYEEFVGLVEEEPAPAPAPALHTDWSWEDLF